MTEDEIKQKKTKICELCQSEFQLAGLTSRFGGGTVRQGVYMCSKCESQHGREIIKPYQSPKAGKMHLTDAERLSLAKRRVVAAGPRYYGKQ